MKDSALIDHCSRHIASHHPAKGKRSDYNPFRMSVLIHCTYGSVIACRYMRKIYQPTMDSDSTAAEEREGKPLKNSANADGNRVRIKIGW